ncbi:hypothetical protein LWI29_000571 [Acer saccharum]|uniref:carnosine N-methyltransferase n=1 Tax=Acer saccharum TaxID=4024 RepID=A0AA39VMS3_ACESA|nr:hypothetical protein LWI29_000571 [Acer saccharum]
MEEEDEERCRQRRLEEALEVKSLRRIISAYLNYPEAAYEDVKRYEKCFRKLSPAHKAFDPPLDMSQDMDICEEPHEHAHNDNLLSGERNACPCHPASTSGRMCFTEVDQACSEEQNNEIHKTSEGMDTNEEVETEDPYKSKTSSLRADLENRKETDQSCSNDIADSNGNVSSSPREWLNPSFQLNVPLVDVDKGQKERDQCYKPILEELDALFPNRSDESPPACLVPGAGLGRLALEISCLGVWDAVVTCFFIDTAHNIVEYIEIISRILKEGGVWINLGPLLYHFADMYGQEDEMSIELSLEDVKKVALHYGFEFEKEKTIETTYTANPRSMMQNRYYAAFWTARKKSATLKHASS